MLPPKFEITPFNFNGAGGNPRVDPAQLDALKWHRDNWAEEREKIYDLVWWRRVAYFSTVAFTTLLVLLPGYVQRVMYPPTTDGQWIWGRLTSWTKILPWFVEPWIRASQTSPLVFFALILLVIAGSLIGMRLEHATRSNMRDLWQKRLSGDSFESSRRSWVEKLRRMPAYQQTIQDLKWYTFPWLVGLFLLLPGILYLLYFALTQVSLSFVDPGLCTRTRTDPMALPTQGMSSFDTRRPCNSTGVQVQAGQPYAIELAAPRPIGAAEPWFDGKYPASPMGISARTLKAPGYLGAPLRRLLDARYLQVIYQIRPKKRPDGPWHPVVVHALDFTANKANPSCWIYRADFVAREPGELFLFANDAVAPWDFGYFYRNNRGTAQVYVHALHNLGGEPIKSAVRLADACRLTAPGGTPVRTGGG